MDKQNVILKTHELEVIGQGPMVYEPVQIGEWWVMPAEMYTGTVPPEIQTKWDNFKALNLPVVGYLIADDMRDVLVKRAKEAQEALEREQKAEQERRLLLEKKRQDDARKREEERQAIIRRQQAEKDAQDTAKAALMAVGVIAGVGLVVATGGAILVVGAALAALFSLDWCPMLIAVLPDGRWVCVGAWWD